MKKIFFIHVGKTAGSSFNRFLRSNFVGEEHCEQFLNNDLSFSNLNYLKSLDYISGHLKLKTFFRNELSINDYFLLTFLREPNSQLLSHLNWIIHIHDVDPEFFLTHPANIREICLYLREQNLYDTDTFIKVLTELAGMFRNNQSRHFIEEIQTAKDMESIKSEAVIHELLKLDMVGITEFYRQSLDLFIHTAKLNVSAQVDRENQNNFYRLTKDILNNDSIHNFLYDYNRVDHEVYTFFYKRFQAAYQILSMIKSRTNHQHKADSSV